MQQMCTKEKRKWLALLVRSLFSCLFPSVGHLGVTGEEFAEGLLKAKSVAVVPGSAFGESGKYHVRCCYATSMEKLKIAVQKIAEYVEELKNK